jgi:general secretion pathway protein G
MIMSFVLIKGGEEMKKGFTLIELLVVISIIGILASLTLVSYTGAQKQTRDTQRRSDLNQYRNALETYASSNDGVYPDSLSSIGDLCSVLSPSYMSTCPSDPTASSSYGFYSSASGDEYVVYGGLETTGAYWEVCSNGTSGNVDTEPADSTCDL